MIIESGQTATDIWGNQLVPLSVKGIVEEHGKIWLRRNEWGKWELPGGRVDGNEQAEDTVIRELAEELGLQVTVDHLVDFYIWHKDFGHNPTIGIVTFLCHADKRTGELELHGEAGKARFEQFSAPEALKLPELPELYKRAIQRAYENHRN